MYLVRGISFKFQFTEQIDEFMYNYGKFFDFSLSKVYKIVVANIYYMYMKHYTTSKCFLILMKLCISKSKLSPKNIK